MSTQELITDHLDLWTGATTTKSKSGRGSSSKTELVGIQKLRELILELATKGKLTIQNPQTESANELMAEVQSIKSGLEDAGKIKKQKRTPPIEHEKLTFSIPKNWAWVRLAELTEKIGSGATPRGGKSAYVTNGIPFFRSQNIWNDGLNLTDVAYIPVETHGKMANTHVYPDDILLNITGASLGRTTIVPSEIEEANVSQHVTIIRIIPPVSREFIHYLLLSPYVQAMVWGRQVGMAREGLSKKVLELFELPLPPLEEQHRIVQKVDELMALCDRLEQQTSDQIAAHDTLVDTLLGTLTQSQNATELAENWTRLAAHFDTLFTTEQSIHKLKQTILQLAVMGRLVEQDARDEPAQALIAKLYQAKTSLISEGKLKKSRKLPDVEVEEADILLPPGWRLTRLGEAYDVRDGTHDSPQYHSSGYALITSKNLSSGDLSFNDVKLISETDHQKIQERSSVRQGDILFAMIGSIGNPVIVDTDREFSIKNVALFKYYSEELSCPPFLKLFLENAAETLKQQAAGGVQPFVSLGKLRNWLIPLPPLAEQQRIAQKVDELMTLCDRLKERLNQASATRCQLAESIVESTLQ